MNSRDHRVAGPARRVAAFLGMLVAIATIPACRSDLVPVGSDGRAASFVLGTLTTDLGPEHDVMTIAAAAESALMSRGYTITRRTTSQREARLGGEYPGAAERSRSNIHIYTLHTGIRIHVTVQPMGDLAESQALMDATLAKLGK